jgi:hypothetical protein
MDYLKIVIILSLAAFCKKIIFINKNKYKNIESEVNDFGMFVTYEDNNNNLIQFLDCCYTCKKELCKYNTSNYFAFDKKYCKNCWIHLQKNIFNN